MKRFCALFITAIFVLGLVASPVFAGGGKQHGSVGQGFVDQGDTADAPGNDAQGNMVDP